MAPSTYGNTIVFFAALLFGCSDPNTNLDGGTYTICDLSAATTFDIPLEAFAPNDAPSGLGLGCNLAALPADKSQWKQTSGVGLSLQTFGEQLSSNFSDSCTISAD